MAQRLDYDRFAETYAATRSAVPWILEPLLQAARQIDAGATVAEIGCGTGNYIRALAEAVGDREFVGFDVTEEMLALARRFPSVVRFLHGDAEQRFPLDDASCRLAFAVDVVHHLEAFDIFFSEAARSLAAGGRLLIVTDSEENIRTRSLTTFFPEVLEIELARYPAIAVLERRAARAGLRLHRTEFAEGRVALIDDFIAKLDRGCSSGLRLISREAQRAGIARLLKAAKHGDAWHSCYSILYFEKSHTPSTRA
jgi:SAM-dependent methyltransferase